MTDLENEGGRAARLPGSLIPGFAAGCLALAVLGLAWRLADGPFGWAYLVFYALFAVPGLPVGFALFGRRHAAGWIAGTLVGYGITAVAMWAPVQIGLRGDAWFVGFWGAAIAIVFLCLRRVGPLTILPAWSRRDTAALLFVLLAVPALVWKPFANIGVRDDDGNRRYRAYFTADFLWHVALTAELARLDSPPRNPYLTRRSLNYYWAYFVPPAIVSRAGMLPSIQAHLTINALCAGMLFVSAIFLAAWCAVPRAGPVAAATLLALLAASAEGLQAIWHLKQQGQPLDSLRHLNIDAITAWFLQGLSVDGLPRSLWYTPQHAAACALSLVALVVPARAASRQPLTGLLAGIALGLALIFSPFLGGAFSLIYGLTALWVAMRSGRRALDVLLTTVPAALPVLVALGWCIANGTFEGARGTVAIGLSRMAAAAPFLAPAFALGPLLAVSLPGLLVGRTKFHIEAAVAALLTGFALFYFVTLTSEPVWIGWRAGQILLVTLPALAAATLAALSDRGRPGLAVAGGAAALCAGFPTTVIDTYNAQDVLNTEIGAGFRWTVVVPPETQAAVEWIRRNTPPDAIVQMSIGPRGRETWTLIPSFAHRRMAAGRPISLLHMPDYDVRSAEADGLFRTPDAAEAARVARALRIDYVYVDRVEREAFGEPAMAKFGDVRFFAEAFRQDAAAVYAVRGRTVK